MDGNLRDGGERAPVRLALLASGRVQRVGLRSYTRGLARHFGLSGWVRNRPDGDVDMEVQGPARAVEDFLAALVTPMPNWRMRVTGLRRRELPPVPGERGFLVRRWGDEA